MRARACVHACVYIWVSVYTNRFISIYLSIYISINQCICRSIYPDKPRYISIYIARSIHI